MKIKLLVLSFYYYPDLGSGSFRTAALIDHLQRQKREDISIDLITTMPNRYASFRVSAPELECQDQLRIRRISVPSHRNSSLGQAWAFIHYAYQVIKIVRNEEYKVVYATTSGLMIASLAAWIAKQQKSILFLDIRALFVDTLKDILPKIVARMVIPFFSKLEKWTFSNAQHINLVSKGFQPYIQQRFPNKTLTFYPNGIDKEFLQHGFNSTNKPSEQFTLLYVGTIGKGQELERIIPLLAKRLEGCAQIKIIGDGRRKIHLETAIHAQGCTNVELYPPISRDALLQAYSDADVLFLHLNRHQAFHKTLPAKIFEYAATGKPILAGVSGYAAEFIKTEISNVAIFQPGDSEQALKCIANLNFLLEDREIFIKKYHRDTVMHMLVSDIVSYCEKNVIATGQD